MFVAGPPSSEVRDHVLFGVLLIAAALLVKVEPLRRLRTRRDRGLVRRGVAR